MRLPIFLVSTLSGLCTIDPSDTMFAGIKELGMAIVVAWVIYFLLTRIEKVMHSQARALDNLTNSIINHDKNSREFHEKLLEKCPECQSKQLTKCDI
jgi:hypothetical protein